MIVLDTHTLIWWLKDKTKLSVQAKRQIDLAKKNNGIYISSISIWEIALLVQKGKVDLGMDVKLWIEKLRKSSLHFVPVDNEIALTSVYLPGNFHKDPADRIIVATARCLGAKLITVDAKIRAYKHVQTVG